MPPLPHRARPDWEYRGSNKVDASRFENNVSESRAAPRTTKDNQLLMLARSLHGRLGIMCIKKASCPQNEGIKISPQPWSLNQDTASFRKHFVISRATPNTFRIPRSLDQDVFHLPILEPCHQWLSQRVSPTITLPDAQ